MSRVSVLVPNYNGAAYLRQCLQSVQAQTFSDWTLVVGDNASTDGSRGIVEAVADPRVRLTRRPRTIGWVANVNLLLAEVGASEYVAVLHADDWWDPGFLSAMVDRLDRSPTSLMATSTVRLVRDGAVSGVAGLSTTWTADRGERCPPAEAVRALTLKSCIYAPGVLTRAETYRRVGGYDESLPNACDWLMWMRVAAVSDVEVIAEPLANYRIHDGSLTAQIGRANLRGMDLARVVVILQSEWEGREPFLGARRQLANTVVTQLLAEAIQWAEQGDQGRAVMQARLARAVAASIDRVALTWVAERVVEWTNWPLIRRGRRPIMRLARSAWHAAH